METITLVTIKKEGSRIAYAYRVSPGLERFFSDYPFTIEYPESIESVPDAILAVPFVCCVLPIVWITDSELIVPELDEAFYNCLPEVKQGYETMYPETAWRGKVTVGRVVPCVRPAQPGACAMFFSGGVDSVFTLISHLEEKPACLSIWGSDIDVENREGWQVLCGALKEQTEALQFDSAAIKSSFRRFDREGALDRAFSASLQDGWWHGVKHGLAMLGHAAPYAYLHELESVYIAASNVPENGPVRCASDPLIDDHIRFAACQVIHDGHSFQRQKKIGEIVRFSREQGPVRLHVCWKTQTGSNCCRCEKCYRTVAGILAEGGDPDTIGFPGYRRELDKMPYVVLTQTSPYLFRVEWIWVKKRILENLSVLERSPDWKYLKWILRTDFAHPETIKLSLLCRVQNEGIKKTVRQTAFGKALLRARHKISARRR